MFKQNWLVSWLAYSPSQPFYSRVQLCRDEANFHRYLLLLCCSIAMYTQVCMSVPQSTYEPRREKTGLREFRPAPT